MMRFLKIIAILACLSGSVSAEEPQIMKVSKPHEVVTEVKRYQAKLPQELEGLVWNRWKSKNFVVCSLDNPKAQYLHKHLELVKGWIFARWGMYDVDFSVPCKLICVDNPELFKKLFGLTRTKAETRRGKDGRIGETVIFLLMNEEPSKIVPMPLTYICLAEFGQKYNVRFNMWAVEGMQLLNSTLPHIRERIVELKPTLDQRQPIYMSKNLLMMDFERYKKLSEQNRRLYDGCAMMFCLMIRKELGQEEFLKTLQKSTEGNPAAVVQMLGYRDHAHFDRAFVRFMKDLANDVSSGKTPDHYLQVRELGK